MKNTTNKKTNNLTKILSVLLSVLFILSCFTACNKNPTDEMLTTVEEDTTVEDEATTAEEETTAAKEETTEEITEESTTKNNSTTTTNKETTTTKPVTTTNKQETTTTKVTYTNKKETVYATTNVNIRKSPSTSSSIVGGLKKGDSITRTAIGSNGWSKVSYNGTTAYISSTYLTATKPTTQTTTTTKKTETTTKNTEPTTQKVESTTKNTNEDLSKLGSALYDPARAGRIYDKNGNLSSYDKIGEGETYYKYDEGGYKEALVKPYSKGNEPATINFDICQICGKSTVRVNGEAACAHGGCTRWVSDMTCPYCGTFVKANTCHTCKK